MATATETKLKEIRDEIHMLVNVMKDQNRLLCRIIDNNKDEKVVEWENYMSEITGVVM